MTVAAIVDRAAALSWGTVTRHVIYGGLPFTDRESFFGERIRPKAYPSSLMDTKQTENILNCAREIRGNCTVLKYWSVLRYIWLVLSK